MPAAGAQSAQHGGPRRLFVKVERLRIELPRIGDDLLFAEDIGAEKEMVADGKIVEISEGRHARFLSAIARIVTCRSQGA